MNSIDARLPAAIEAAAGHVKATVQAVAERVTSGLGNQAQLATRILERDLLLSAQVDLRRKINAFHLCFAKELMDKVQEEVGRRGKPQRSLAATDWQSLSLVDDHEVEERMFSHRIGQQIAHACEWELRELAAYMGTVLNLGCADEERNPLRADVLGMAIVRSIGVVSSDPDARKLLAREFGQALAESMPQCYQAITRELQHRKVQPVGLSVKTVHGPGQSANSGYASIQDTLNSTRTQSSDFMGSSGSDFVSGHMAARNTISSRGGIPSTGRGTMATQPAPYASTGSYTEGLGRAGSGPARSGRAGTEADAHLMSLLRRLTFLASRPGVLDGPAATSSSSLDAAGGSRHGAGLHGAIGALTVDASGAAAAGAYAGDLSGLMAVNLIRAHRDELMQASTGKLDHMVIDVVGSLFDQILSDPKVPPQMARQIARLQLPVLRVALVDSNFFSSRRHPVRRFVNRIASLACGFDDFDDGPGKEFLDRVKGLVQEIVEGDFDQIELYSAKLTELENFIAHQTEEGAKSSGAATVLETKESELRIQQRYMLQISTGLAGVTMPDYLRDFVSQVWSQALVLGVRLHGAESDIVRRFRCVGRDLVMSVQPKGSPIMRKRFLMQLPALMKDLNEGLKLIGWPETAQKDFFSKLLPAHAESLKATSMTELEYNLLAKELEAVFNAAIPGAHDFSHAEPVTLGSKEIEQRFTADEAQMVGLVEESAVDWSGEVDIDLTAGMTDADGGPGTVSDGGDTQPSSLDLDLDLGIDIDLNLTAAADPAEPSHGPRLMDHVRVGFAYQMLLKDQWQKVRLSYVSPGRNFFVFTRGRKHQETISLTTRMLSRMCESNRLRAVEHAYLMERATARARRQLAALKSKVKH